MKLIIEISVLNEGADVLKNVLMTRMVRLRFNKCNISSGFPCYKQGMHENLVILTLFNCKFWGDAMDELDKYPILQS